jgi:ElaB/YqjD/DUF883 family membrane-anchored ribosome-binding protein
MNDQVTADKLLGLLQTVIRDSDALLKATATYAGDKVDHARSKAEESLRAAKARLADVQENVVEQARDFISTGDQYVRDKPWQSIGFAAAIGFLLGALIARSRGRDS